MQTKTLISGFGLKLPAKEEIIKKLNSSKTEIKVEKKINLKSNKLTLEQKLIIIKDEVLKRLGKYASNTQVIRDKESLNDYLQKSIKNGIISIDTETNNSTDPITCKIMGLCLYTPNEKQVYIPINHINNNTGELLENQLTENDLNYFMQELNKNNVKIIMHNASFDIKVIDFTCMNGKHNSVTCYWDTMLAAKVIDENGSAKLKDLYQRYIDPNQESYNIETFFKGVLYEQVDPNIFALYAATDAYETYELYLVQVEIFKQLNDKHFYNVFKELEMNVLPCVVEMEETGLGVDKKYVENLQNSYHKTLEDIKIEVDKIISEYKPQIDTFRINNPTVKLDDPILITSPSQLAVLIYDILKLEPTDESKPRGTGKKELENLDHPLIKHILRFKEFEKLVSTFIDKLPKFINPKTGKIHASFNQIGKEDNTVVTGRFSCSDPNIQQIPSHDKKIRSIFVPDDGMVIVGGDFSLFNVG